MCKSKPPEPNTPGAAPAPPADPAQAPKIDAESANTYLNAKRAGRRSMRIDLASSGPSGGAGLNIPS